MIKRVKILSVIIGSLLILIGLFWLLSLPIASQLLVAFESRESTLIEDRNGEIIQILPNADGFYAVYSADVIPAKIAKLLIAKEDKYFYLHPGVNPMSTLRAIFAVFTEKSTASSTITQQLVKILLNHESDRTIKNKLQEMVYSFGLELHASKEEILQMYVNSIYFGNQVQGIKLASNLYFNVSPGNLTEAQIIQLLATISSPSNTNPFMDANVAEAFALQEKLAKNLTSTDHEFQKFTEEEKDKLRKSFKNYITTKTAFEVNSMNLCDKITVGKICHLTIDLKLNEKIRTIIQARLIRLYGTNAEHAAVVIFKEPEHELVAIVGSPNPSSMSSAYQINMAVQNRPIGSTIKPFLYGLGFEKKLRPYSLVDDREYKFTTGAGFAHYPKNYDYKYRGIVTLHESLSNSLNVPAVKVLEFIGLQDFYKFLTDRLEFIPVQPLENYQYGIALGQLEMTLLQLTNYFSIFANEGYLQDKQIFDSKYVQLVNRITTDRDAASDQFGITGNLRVEGYMVGVKTGTSREYHDSWTVGYTPDFVVGVWVGNAKNLPMTDISGQTGAGGIWNDAVTLMIDSDYNRKIPFSFDQIKSFRLNDSIYFGLPNDTPSDHINLMINEPLILSPHSGDTLLFKNDMNIALHASEIVKWYIDDTFIAESTSATFSPKSSGQINITAKSEADTETITVDIVSKQNNNV
ncbi:MAG: transglycosylase domain-containing protein [Candidatus Peregrinibacteria bacterium]|nr:transglycosylase domain-containing protein [Candidatus Peregrinibacteria bacterium]